MGGSTGGGRHGWFAGLRAWDRRVTQWSFRHPWWWAAMLASIYPAIYFLGYLRYGYGPSPWTLAFAWLVLFFVSASVTKVKASRPQPREPLSTPPTDLTLRGDSGPGMGEDGRRWRTGGP